MDSLKVTDNSKVNNGKIKDIITIGFQQTAKTNYNREHNHYKNKKIEKLLSEMKPLYIDRFYMSLFNGDFGDENSIWKKVEFLHIKLSKGYYSLLVIEIERNEVYKPNTNYVEEEYMFDAEFRDILTNCCHSLDIFLMTQTDDSHFAVIINREYINNVHKSFGLLLERLNTFLNQNDIYKISIGASNISSDVLKISELYNQCLQALKCKQLINKLQVIYYKDLEEESDTYRIKFSNLQEEVNFLLNSGIEGDIGQFINHISKGCFSEADRNRFKGTCIKTAMCIQIVLNGMDSDIEDIFSDNSFLWSKLIDSHTSTEINGWIKELLISAQSYIKGLKINKSCKIVKEIIQYLEQDYKKNLTVKEISERFYFSPNYINHIFKEKTGKSIPDYLMMIRMEKARKLLKERDLKIYEIVEEVGYTRTSYFASLFKKYTGLTPKEYRETV